MYDCETCKNLKLGSDFYCQWYPGSIRSNQKANDVGCHVERRERYLSKIQGIEVSICKYEQR